MIAMPVLAYTPDYSSCVTGTINLNTLQCTAVINGKYSSISICRGDETTGACRIERMTAEGAAQAAAERAAELNDTCYAIISGFPGIDPNTGVNYFYGNICEQADHEAFCSFYSYLNSSVCTEDESSSTSSSASSSSSSSSLLSLYSTSSVMTTAEATEYIQALKALVQRLTESYKSLLESIGKQ